MAVGTSREQLPLAARKKNQFLNHYMENFTQVDQEEVSTQTVNSAEMEYIETLKEELISTIAKSANWFFGIAGLTVINTLFSVFNKSGYFILGLGFTQLIDGAIISAFGSYNFVALFLDFIFVGLFVFLAFMAKKMNKWAFIVGGVIYFLDALIFLAAKEWFAFGFHLFVLYILYKGIMAIKAYNQINA
ncbi:hypothetical protein C3K47_17150 [Solitalea longa]|uniref:Uncharacterized protein n=1 Tax=Solitalea longa TaxID=2079460 RepID=A0A2S4ZXE9_9SPHI|nr:hypothetical protein [Solitalea longa]POY34985.1 hypothetical protein C3K47_17150 [Solitalea longa]